MAEATPSSNAFPGSWPHRLRRLATAALDLALPPRCLGCGEGVPVQGELCPACWSTIRFLHAPWCDRCGTPLPFEDPRLATCNTCRAHPPPFDRARAAVAYDPASARLVIGFKRRDRIEAAATFAAWMRNAGRELLDGADLLVPVPLHRWRLWQRGYNQSCLLAKRLAALSGVPWSPDTLRRVRATASQRGLGGGSRLRNVTAEAFAVADRRRARVTGAKIVLIDDVLTTGATVAACVEILRAAGAIRVDVLTLSRVVRGEKAPISS